MGNNKGKSKYRVIDKTRVKNKMDNDCRGCIYDGYIFDCCHNTYTCVNHDKFKKRNI